VDLFEIEKSKLVGYVCVEVLIGNDWQKEVKDRNSRLR
jgi:hypothetical protein